MWSSVSKREFTGCIYIMINYSLASKLVEIVWVVQFTLYMAHQGPTTKTECRHHTKQRVTDTLCMKWSYHSSSAYWLLLYDCVISVIETGCHVPQKQGKAAKINSWPIPPPQPLPVTHLQAAQYPWPQHYCYRGVAWLRIKAYDLCA